MAEAGGWNLLLSFAHLVKSEVQACKWQKIL